MCPRKKAKTPLSMNMSTQPFHQHCPSTSQAGTFRSASAFARIAHIVAYSAGTLSSQSLHYDMVRVGLALYGQSPAAHLSQSLELRPAMSVKARVTLLRDVPAGVGISYGHQHITARPSRLAVLGIGYADGVSRRLSGRMQVLAKGHRLPQVGAITMDQLVVDATTLPDLKIGDAVTLLGRCGEAEISPWEWSDSSDTIPWEVLCSFKHRLPRLPSGH